MLTWELVGAVVGAGLASGREIASFFSQYGVWSYGGILIAVWMLVFLGDTRLPPKWKNHWLGRLWKTLMSMLLIATGGAMLSGSGEIAALIIPMRHAYWLGICTTLALAWLLAHRTTTGLARVSRVLLVLMIVMIGLGLFLPSEHAAVLQPAEKGRVLLRGLTYGGFNAALQAPILSKSLQTDQNKQIKAVRWAGRIILCLLMLGNTVLQRHSELLGEALPFVKMLTAYGKAGYYLGAICTYFAILSTLTACLRGLNDGWLALVSVLVMSLLGFSGVVEWAYPLLGGGCFLMLLSAKFMNCS